MVKPRAVCLNCIDGRFQEPVINWIRDNVSVDIVDMITEPGMDGFLADTNNSDEDICRKIRVSVQCNNTQTIVITGHGDCKGNPVDDSVHKNHIREAVDRMKKRFEDIKVLGLWMDSEYKGEVISR